MQGQNRKKSVKESKNENDFRENVGERKVVEEKKEEKLEIGRYWRKNWTREQK